VAGPVVGTCCQGWRSGFGGRGVGVAVGGRGLRRRGAVGCGVIVAGWQAVEYDDGAVYWWE
jgi:hypothetical protein